MLALATLRDRWRAFVGSFVALTLGVAVLTATLVVFDSARPAVPDRLAGAPVIVQSPTGGDDSESYVEYVPWSPERTAELVAALSRVPGVLVAVPDRSFYAQLVRDGRALGDPSAGDPLGHSWSSAALAPLRLAAGVSPAAPDEVVLDAGYGVAPGEEVNLLTATGPTRWTVAGTVDAPGIYVSDVRAAQLAPGVTAIGLLLDDAADTDATASAVRAAVGVDGIVRTGAGRAALEPEAHARTRWIGTQLLTVMALLGGFAAIFVMASTSALGAYQRRRELALLRAVGATPRQVRRALLGEALLVGLVAAVAGAVLGTLLAPVLGDLLVRAELEPPGFTTRAAPGPVAGAIGLGIAVSLLGAWAAARRAGRVRPIEALREAAVDRRAMPVGRWVVGGLLVAAGVGLAALTPAVDADAALTTALFSAFALILGLAAVAPAVVPPVFRAATAPLDRFGGATGTLVRESASTAVRRTAATVAPVLLTVGFTALMLGMVATASPAFGGAPVRAAGAEAVVAPQGTPGLSDAAVAAAPGTVTSALVTQVFSGARRDPLDAAGVDPAVRSELGGGDALIAARATAGAQGWTRGGTATLTFADGRTGSFRVAAVVPDADLPSPVLLSAAVVRRHDPSALTPVAYVRGAAPSTVDAAVAGLGAAGVDPATFSADDDEDRLVWLFALVAVGMAVCYTGIAVVNTVVMATGDRRRDFAALRLAGATAGQVLRAVSAETGLVVAFGAAAGLAIALPALLGVRAALTESVGAPVALVLPWPQIGAVVGACAVLALVAAASATRLALRAPAKPATAE